MHTAVVLVVEVDRLQMQEEPADTICIYTRPLFPTHSCHVSDVFASCYKPVLNRTAGSLDKGSTGL